jgi:hypothetical protein
MIRTAVIAGTNNSHRYELRRVWDAALPLLVVCMLNPSTADHERDDPTVLTLIHFAKGWGFGGILVINLFGLRTSHPRDLLACEDRFGIENWKFIAAAMEYARDNGGRLLAAWGNGGDLDDRAEWFCSRALSVYKLNLICLGTTLSWKPKHPLARGQHRIPRDQQPIVYRSAPEVGR